MSQMETQRNDRVVQKYLNRYAEPEIQEVSDLPGTWSKVATIPACREHEGLIQAVQSLDVAASRQVGRTLLIVVINARDDATPETYAVNDAALTELTVDARAIGEGAWLKSLQSSDLVVVDRSSEGRRFPSDQGVGLARKIGCDIALALWAVRQLDTAWIRTTDADAIVPETYFDDPDDVADASAMIYPFYHRLEGPELFQEATLLYDLSLRYYVLGLIHAGSPYAFQTVGSTIAIAPGSYAQVRGFPRKKAAEDFYLLNKLAKVGRIYERSGDPIHLQGRPSDRVPFGTGAGVTKITEATEAGHAFTLYDPRTFDLLKQWLVVMESFAEHTDIDRLSAQLREWNWSEAELTMLHRLGAMKMLAEAATNTKSPQACLRRLHIAFDAFRTLKFVHTARDQFLPSLSWRKALECAEFVPLEAGQASSAAAAAAALSLL